MNDTYTFEQNLKAAEILITKVLCTMIEHMVHAICLIALASYNLGRLIGKYYYEQTESIRAVKLIAANLQTTDEVTNVKPYDPWMDTFEMFEEEIDEYCEKVRNLHKIHGLETQYLLPPADVTSLGYKAPKKGRCRKGYRRIDGMCVPISSLTVTK